MFNIRFATDYILHRLKAKNRHGLHSPFVYRLADEVIYDFSAKEIYPEIENLRSALLSDNRVINITDLGAGSNVKKSNKKKISEIARNSLKSPKLAQLLYRLIAKIKPTNIIELGTCLGITTIYLQKAAPNARVFTLEGSIEIADVAQSTFNKTGYSPIELIRGNFDQTMPETIAKLKQIDFVFVDGNHQKEATLQYFNWCMPKVHQNSVLIFDDIYWSKGMKEAWKEIKADPRVTVTVDLFWIGLVFFRTGQAKEHFLLKI